MNIIALAFDMAKAVEVFMQKAKKFFYSVMLLGHRCPKCDGALDMEAEEKCRCSSCGLEFDPTIEFERCLNCGGVPVLNVRRYKCSKCGSDIKSKFLFQGLLFNADYFREKVIESRQRRAQQREQVKKLLAECKSSALSLEAVDLGSIPGLVDTLNSLTAGLDMASVMEYRDKFDLSKYESHIRVHVSNNPLSLAEIPLLSEDKRKDLIWRFVAVIFLAHAGVVDIWQEGTDIMMIKHETNRERQDIPGKPEATDGV